MLSGSAKSSAGILIALLSAATFATSGPVRQVAAQTGWTPGSVVFLRIAGAALLLLVPTVRALGGRWHLLRREWRQVVAYGLIAVALPQLAFFYAVAHLSVGVALLLEYLGTRARRRLAERWSPPRAPASDGARRRAGPDRAGARARRVRRCPHRRHRRGVGPARGARPDVVLPDVRQHARRRPATARRWPAAVSSSAAVTFAVLGLIGVLPMEFRTRPVELAGISLPWWARRPRAGRDRGGHGVRRRDRGRARARRQAGLVRRALRGPVRRAVRVGAARRAAPARSSWSAACSSWPAWSSYVPKSPARSGSAGGTPLRAVSD